MVLDEGIYGWILHLIEEGKIARIVDRCNWIYELDWQDAVWKYWHEFRKARRGGKSPLKKDNFNIRTASNGLRAALLNSYKDKGAKEYPEKKVMDKDNKSRKQCLKLPSNVFDSPIYFLKLSTVNASCVMKDKRFMTMKTVILHLTLKLLEMIQM